MAAMPALNREAWLQKASTSIRKAVFAPKGLTVAEFQVSVGFPSQKALSRTQQRIGECWVKGADQVGDHVFISPVLKADRVLDVLVHEMLHVVTPEAQHGGMFKRLMPVIGLEGKPTATTAGKALKATLAEVASKLGPYPHKALTAAKKMKTQTTRLLKIECPACGYLARVTSKWLDAGDLICAIDRVVLVREEA